MSFQICKRIKCNDIEQLIISPCKMLDGAASLMPSPSVMPVIK